MTKEEILEKLNNHDEWSMLKDDPIFVGILDKFFEAISKCDSSNIKYWESPTLRDESGDTREIAVDEVIFDISLKHGKYEFIFSLYGCLESSLEVLADYYVDINDNEYTRISTSYRVFLEGVKREVVQKEQLYIGDDLVDSKENIYFYDQKFNPFGDANYQESALDARFAACYDLDIAIAHEYRLHFRDHFDELADKEASLMMEDFLLSEDPNDFERPFTIDDLLLYFEARLKDLSDYCDNDLCEECRYADVCPYEDVLEEDEYVEEDFKNGEPYYEEEDELDENEYVEDIEPYMPRIENLISLFSKAFETNVPMVISYQFCLLLEQYILGDTRGQLKYEGVIITFENGEYWRNFISLTENDIVINRKEVLSSEAIEDYRKKGRLCIPSLREFFSLGEGKHPVI